MTERSNRACTEPDCLCAVNSVRKVLGKYPAATAHLGNEGIVHMAKRSTSKQPRHSSTPGHRHAHGQSRCLSILRRLSAYIDDELSVRICQEIRQHFGDCPNCETFMVSLRQTVLLCHHRLAPTLSTADRALMREKIFKSA